MRLQVGEHCVQDTTEETRKLRNLAYSWGVSRKLATSVNQGDKILTTMDVLKCTQMYSN